jgi:hypothetical protein
MEEIGCRCNTKCEDCLTVQYNWTIKHLSVLLIINNICKSRKLHTLQLVTLSTGIQGRYSVRISISMPTIQIHVSNRGKMSKIFELN